MVPSRDGAGLGRYILPSKPRTKMRPRPCHYFDKAGNYVSSRGPHNPEICRFAHPGSSEWREALRYADPDQLYEQHRQRQLSYNRSSSQYSYSRDERARDDRARDSRPRDYRYRDDRPGDDDLGPPRKRPRADSPPRQLRGDVRQYSPTVRSTPVQRRSISDQPIAQTTTVRSNIQASNSPSSDRNGEPVAESQRRTSLSSLPRPPSTMPPSPSVAMPPPPPPSATAASGAARPPPSPVAAQVTAPTISSSSTQQFAAPTVPRASTMSIMQSIMGTHAPPPDIPVEEQRRRWIDRVEGFAKLVRALKEKQEVEEELQLRKSLLASERFAQAAGPLQNMLEASVQDETTRLAEASEKYDVLLQEFITADFWPVPRPGQLPDTDEGVRHFYWKMREELKRLDRKVSNVASGSSAISSHTPDGDENMVDDLEVDPPPQARAVNLSDAEVVNKIYEDVISAVATEVESRLEGLRAAIQGKTGTEEMSDLTTQLEQYLEALDKKITSEIARIDADQAALTAAAELTSLLAPRVNKELYPAVHVIEKDLAALKDFVEASFAKERTATNDQLADIQAGFREEFENVTTANKDLVENERSARAQLETLLNNLRADVAAVTRDAAAAKADYKNLVVSTKQQLEELKKKSASQAETITVLQQGLAALQAANAPPVDSTKDDISKAVVEEIHAELKPIISGLIEKINSRLQDHSAEIFNSVLGKLAPMLKVNEAIYSLLKKHELSHLSSVTPPAPNSSQHGIEGTPT